MTGLQQFLLFSLVIYGSLLVGWTARETGLLNESSSARIMRRTIIFLEPPLILLIYWALDLSRLRVLIVMPLAATLISIASLLVGRLVAQALGHKDRSSRGSFVCCAMFSNVGLSMGSFISFLLLQQQGLSMGSLYAAYFVPFFFTVGMVVVRRYSANEEHSTLGMIRRFFCDPISIAPNLGILAGLTANFLSGGHRPEALKPLATGLLLTTVSIYSVGIGLSMRFGRIARFWRDCLGMSFVKFVAAPLIGLSVGLFLGCHEISGGLALKVVLIQSSMPVAIFALVMCKLFDLDMDVANSCWLFTTLATVGVFLALRAVVPAI